MLMLIAPALNLLKNGYTLIKPIEEWVHPKDGLVVGLEFPLKEEQLQEQNYPREICAQWVFAAKAGHPVLVRLKKLIIDKITSEKQPFGVSFLDTLKRTGPGIFSQAVKEYVEELGGTYKDFCKGGKIGDLRIYPQKILSMWPEKAHADSCVLHGYQYSWAN